VRNRLTVTILAGQESGCDVFGDGWQIVGQIQVGENIFHKVGEAIPPGKAEVAGVEGGVLVNPRD
jgi:hypothetical protein